MDQHCLGEQEGFVERCAAAEFDMPNIWVEDIGRRACATCVGCFVHDREDEIDILRDEREIYYDMAMEDPLTRLNNLRAAQEKFDTFCQRGAVAAAHFDLKNFGKGNKRLGHIVGDMELQETGEYLRNNVRPDNTMVIRTGGDEFVILYCFPHDEDDMDYANDRRSMDLSVAERLERATAHLVKGYDELAWVQAYNRKFRSRKPLGLRMNTSIMEGPETPLRELLNAADSKHTIGNRLFMSVPHDTEDRTKMIITAIEQAPSPLQTAVHGLFSIFKR